MAFRQFLIYPEILTILTEHHTKPGMQKGTDETGSVQYSHMPMRVCTHITGILCIFQNSVVFSNCYKSHHKYVLAYGEYFMLHTLL